MTAAPTPTAGTTELREERPYVLMKRGLYWRPNGQGYTGVLAEAGRYSEVDALAHNEHDHGTMAHLACLCPEFSPSCWPETQIKVLQAARDEALARIATTDADLAKALGEVERWKSATRLLLPFVDTAAGTELELAHTEGGPSLDSMAICYAVAAALGIAVDSAEYEDLALTNGDHHVTG